MNRILSMAVLLPGLFLAAPAACAATNRVAIAVVVNAANPQDSLTREELGRILRQEKQFWADNTAIELHLPGPGAPGRTCLRAESGASNEAALKKQWLGRIFRGQSKREPTQHETAASLAAKVMEQPKSLGLLAADGPTTGLKVLAVDGIKPGEAGYSLVEEIEPR